ncbi:MAG: SMC-Scp complex subunit ScpB [Eubacteriales bacterium]|nr:SMC-Scp complex subunit ScpB [Eubacteriales bacterium]
MERKEIESAMEAMLFAAGDEVSAADLAAVLKVSELEVRSVLDDYADRLRYEQRGIQLIRIEDKVQLCTNAEYAGWVQELLAPQRTKPLTQSALETLSIIAYRQPITRRDIEIIRGVKCDYVVQALQAKGLIAVVGQSDAMGHPQLLGTTAEFLRCFHLESLADLPPLEQMLSEAAAEEAEQLEVELETPGE